MAHVEKRGPGRWRRDTAYRRTRTIKDVPSQSRRRAVPGDSQTDKLRGTWLDPALGKMTYETWTKRYFDGAIPQEGHNVGPRARP